MRTVDAHDPYSRLVGGLKLLLPLAALGILSTLFLMSHPREPQGTLRYTDGEIARIVQEQRIGRPTYAGTGARGELITLRADSALPDPDDVGRIVALALDGTILTPDGGRLDLSADRGSVDPKAQTARLTGDVRAVSGTGWRILTERLDTALDAADLDAPGGVSATGPAGTLDAGAMRLTSDGGRHVLRFTGGVRLLYDPINRAGANE